ncbi:MAG: HAMP domain-containing histidine kinase [Spirochaetes bacterium]|nr:HAMP domain-containing histidine kinase [Spirochaetota bacterium]
MAETILLSFTILSTLFLCVSLANINYKEGRYSLPILLWATLICAIAHIYPSSIAIALIIALYPAVFAVFIHTIIKTLATTDKYIYSIAQMAIILSLFLPLWVTGIILAFIHLYTAGSIHKTISFKYGTKIFQGVLILESVILTLVAYLQNVYFMIITLTGFIIILMTIMIYDILKRSQTALVKIRTLARMNANLTKLNRLLKQKNDQYIAMLNKKDNDIQLLSKYSTMAEITAGIAHEIAQPLTGIKSIAQNMMDDINLDDFNYLEALSELQKICTMVDKATYIIDHIRSFNTNNHIYKLIDINSIIMNAVTLTHNQLKKHNIDILLLLNDSIPKIYGNSISIEQILLNLITNARDAIIEKAKKGDLEYTGKIIIKTDYSDDYVILTIEDNGIGIQPEIQKHIWSPFFTTKKYSQSLGIGLSITKKIINEHNGEIFINSTPNEGSTFTIKFSLLK